MSRKTFALVAGLASIVVFLAGCGSSKSSDANAAGETTAAASDVGTTLQLAADPTGKLEFDKTELDAAAGMVTIVFTNASPVPHDVAIEGNGVAVKSDLISNGETTTVSADLEPGTYEFSCTVAGHEHAGMKGTLVVH